jgi:hypothetical protein
MRNCFPQTAVCAVAIVLVSCSPEPAKTSASSADGGTAAKPAGPPQAVSGKTAFWELYTPAHAWASDLVPLSLKSGEVAGVANSDGKAGVWTAVFGSMSQRAARTYVYSVADQLPDITKGVKAQIAEAWAGPTKDVLAFSKDDFKVDSEAAYKTAAAKAADWLKLKDNAEKPVSLSLGAAARFPGGPIWYILFGNTKSGYVAIVNASSGEILTK